MRILRSSARYLWLTGTTGRILRPSGLAGYYLVRLDQPALYRGNEWLDEIREAAENLEPLAGPG